MHAHRFARVLVLAAGLGGCAPRGDSVAAPRAALLSEGSARTAAECRVAPTPLQLPAAEVLVDAAALREAATAAWAAHGRPAGHVLFSLRFDRGGTNVRRAVLEHSLPEALADSLQQLVFAHRRALEPAEAEWGVRLRMDLGAEPLLRVGRWEVCPPRPRDQRLALASSRGPAGWDVRTDGNQPPDAAIWLRVSLDADGTVTDARVERGRALGVSGWRVLNAVRSIPFIPALEDGYPVPGELSLALPTRVFPEFAAR